MANLFQYQPLDETKEEIRLVELDLSNPNSSRVDLCLIHTKLSQAPRFYALSYTWGAPFDGLPQIWSDPNPTCTVYVNGVEFPVRRNLEAALQVARRMKYPRLWIDAICINNSNIGEKNQQVRIMGEIYKKSFTTMIWLGPESEDSHRVQRILAQRWHSWKMRPMRLKRSMISHEDEHGYERFAKYDLEYEEALKDIQAVTGFLQRSWFRRTWVVQELVLSRNVILTWGLGSHSATTTWESLEYTIWLYFQHYRNFLAIFGLKIDKPVFLNALRNLTFHAIYFRRMRDISLLRDVPDDIAFPLVLDAIRKFEASEPCDKVFATRGLSKILDVIEVDYTLDASVVFTSTTKLALERMNDLRILYLCEYSNIPGLPSWAVDFTTDRTQFTLGSARHVRPGRVYSAGGLSNPSFWFEAGKALVIRGIALGTLSFTGSIDARKDLYVGTYIVKDEVALEPLPWLRKAWYEEWIRQEEQLGETRHNLETYSWTGELSIEAFQRTVCADVKGDSEEDDCRLGKHFVWSAERWDELLQSCMHFLRDRTFAATTLRHFCLVNEGAKSGDVVFVATGAETPFLLRPKGNECYEFVGLAYVHGFMDGEAVTQMQEQVGDQKILRDVEFKII